jgi:hypothetical protein
MTPDEILEIDAKRNHPPGTVAGHLRAEINKFLRQGGHLVRQGNTLFVFNATKKGEVVYHTFNADDAATLGRNGKMFFDMLKKAGADTAVSYFKNEKIRALFTTYIKPYKSEFTSQNGATRVTTALK